MSLRIGRFIERATLLVLLALAFAPCLARAQVCPAGAYCFYVPPGLPLEGSHSSPASRAFDLVLSSPVRTVTGSYTIGNGTPASFSVSPGASFRIPLSGTEGYASAYGVAERRGIFLVADSQDLTVDHREVFDSEQYSETIKRHSIALGTRFRLGGYSLNLENRPNSGVDAVLIYAPTGGTVTLTAPPGATLPFWAEGGSITYTATIGPGQTLAVRTRVGRDLDGALLTSTAPVSVSTGGRGWSVDGCGDDGMDGLVPVSALGTEYVVHLPTGSDQTSNESRVRVIADTDATEVRVDGTLVATLAAGVYYSFQPSALTHIRTSSPALVWMNGALNGCELDTVLIPPIAFAPALTALSLDFNVLASMQSPAAELAILIATEEIDSILLDGTAPTFTANMQVPGRADLSYVRFNVGAGDRNVRAGSDFQAMLASRTQPSGLLAYYNPFRIPGCGNGGLDPGETCDDGNLTDADGCSSTCQTEPGWACTGTPNTCTTVCGDSQLGLPLESCDDGNAAPGDGCNSTCRLEVAITAPPGDTPLSDATPTIEGTADVGATVTVSIGDQTSMVVAGADGRWTLTVPMPLADGMRVVMASARDTRGGTSTAMRTLTIDTTTVLTITYPTDGAVVRETTPTFVGMGEVGSSVDVRLNGTSAGTTVVGADGTWSLTPAMPLMRGANEVTAVATDALGNMITTMAVRFTVDPDTTLAITEPAAGAVVANATPTIRGTGEPGAAIAVALRDAQNVEVMATTTVLPDGSWSASASTPLANGPVMLRATATDTAGNTAEAMVSFTVDATTFVTIESPAADAVVSTATPAIVFTAEPGATFRLWIEQTLIASGTVSPSGRIEVPLFVPLTDGTHSVTVEASDRGGATARDDQDFGVDTTVSFALSSPMAGAVLDSGTVQLSGTGEVGAKVEVRIDGKVVGSGTVGADGTFTITLTEPLPDGSYRAEMYVTDPVGNQDVQNVDFQVTTGPTKPRLEIQNPPDGSHTPFAETALTGLSNPSALIVVVLDGVVLDTTKATARGSWSVRLLSSLAPGEHRLYVATADQFRNTANDLHTFFIEPNATALTIDAPADGSVIRERMPTLSGTAPAQAGLRVALDGAFAGEALARGEALPNQPATPGTWTFVTPTALAEGSHTAQVEDPGGAPRLVSVASGFHVDSKTNVRIQRPAAGAVVGSDRPVFTGTAEANALLRILVDGVEHGSTEANLDGSWSFGVTNPITTGPHHLTVRAQDPLGNEAVADVDFTYDAAKPDSDGDGRTDIDECPALGCPDTDGDGISDERDPDDDGDGLPSALECMEVPCPDTDGDGLADPIDTDDDGDGRPTSDEHIGTTPRDTDGDGVADHRDDDDDGDSIKTREECAASPCPDTDGNGMPNHLDPDDDGDRLPTAYEITDSDARDQQDDDTDGIPNWLDDDANDNGVPDVIDGIADTDGDGLPDYADLDTATDSITIDDSPFTIAGGTGCSAVPHRRGALGMTPFALLALFALRRRRRRDRQTAPSP